ncbi:MAG TPA: phosphatase PAP2 family protein [Acidimicrobiales bacterium]|nr:phosphatase PAP2 family protein [Acidimicrobiales bacterium]
MPDDPSIGEALLEATREDGVAPAPRDASALVAAFDATVDAWFEPLRGRPGPDRIFEVASHLGDWGLVWNMLTVTLALRSDDDARRAPKLVAALGLESLIVNQGIKRLFRRSRPEGRPEMAGRLREPVTTSFPSGHASSAAFATVVLCDGTPGLRPLVIPIAALVAMSRIHTRMHHPSDVVAGACVGWMLGRAAVTVGRRTTRD